MVEKVNFNNNICRKTQLGKEKYYEKHLFTGEESKAVLYSY